MGMAVDAAGQDQLAVRVDLALTARQVAADGRNGFADDTDIRFENVGRGRHASAADHEVVDGVGHKILRSMKRETGLHKTRIRNFANYANSCKPCRHKPWLSCKDR